MSFKPGYVCGFCQKKGTAESMKKCLRCKIASYCDDICKNQDWNNHKTICKKISYLQDLIPKIERNFYDFDLILINPPTPEVLAKMTAAMNLNPDDEYELGPQNLFETRYKYMQFLFIQRNQQVHIKRTYDMYTAGEEGC